MALGKQAKILSKKQINQLIWYLGTLRHPLRNKVIVLLSVKAGLRAKEIAELTWSMITDADGDIGSSIHLTDKASKDRGDRVIQLNMQLRLKLIELLKQEREHHRLLLKLVVLSALNVQKRLRRKLLLICLHHGSKTLGLTAAHHIVVVGHSLPMPPRRSVQSAVRFETFRCSHDILH
jgi:integrase/recombinase XerD